MKHLLLLLVALPAFCQLATPSTTLSTAVPLSGTTQWCVASASSVIVPNTSTGANGSYFLVDREVAQVTGAGISSTCFKVRRGQMGTSASSSHTAASTVWIGQPATSSGDPSRPFNGAFISLVPSGSCVGRDQYTLPVLFVGSVTSGAFPGTPFNCVDGQWLAMGDFHISGLTGAASTLVVDAWGSGLFPTLRMRTAGGTPSIPSAVSSGTPIFRVVGVGYGTTAFSAARAGVQGVTTEAWSDTANGAKINFFTTPSTTAAAVTQWEIADTGDFLPVTNQAKNIGSLTNQVLKVSLSNCTSGASPAVCGAATVGAVAVAAAATALTVATTAVTAKSRIVLTMDSSLGTDLSVTCNTANIAAWVSARTAATSFVITTASGPVTNPMCLSYHIFN